MAVFGLLYKKVSLYNKTLEKKAAKTFLMNENVVSIIPAESHKQSNKHFTYQIFWHLNNQQLTWAEK